MMESLTSCSTRTPTLSTTRQTVALVPPARRRWKTAYWAVPAGLIVAVLAAGMGAKFTAARAQTASAAASPNGIGIKNWVIGLPDAATYSQAAGFAGTYRPGELLFLPPGARFTVQPEPHAAGGVFAARGPEWAAGGGVLSARCEGGIPCEARAPEQAGLYTLDWSGATLRVLVLQRATLMVQKTRTASTVLGRTLGYYLDPATAGVEHVQENAARYQPPEFFTVLDRERLNLPLGEDLALGQLVAFMDKRTPEGHKIYTTQRHTDVLPPSRALCDKLVKLRERLRQRGVAVTRFWITSGFRTPEYNRAIGGAAFSRHCYGDAVDLVIDEDGDHRMDDLNGDGKIDRRDGLVIAHAGQELEAEGRVTPGGIGVYEWDGDESVGSHVHLDCRGFPARWGQISRGRQRIGFDWWSERGEKAAAATPE